MTDHKGIFITFEGPEGGGKTTQLCAVADFLRQQDYPVVVTREPGGTYIGDQIRTVLMEHTNTSMEPRTELLLFQASRAQLVAELILPEMRRGRIILGDRYADSTIAYQGFGYQLFSLDVLKPIIEFATGGLKPDLTLLLDVDVESGLRRKVHEGEWNRLDAKELSFHQRVRQGYLDLALTDPERWVIIDANLPSEQVQFHVRQAVLARIEINYQKK